MKWVTAILGVGLVIAAIGFGSNEGATALILEFLPDVQSVSEITEFKFMLLRIVGLLPLALTSLVLLNVFVLFEQFQKNDVFADRTVKSIREVGTFLILLALSTVLAGVLASLALTFDNPPGQKSVSVSINSHGILTLMIGVLFRFIGQVMLEALNIANENRQFV